MLLSNAEQELGRAVQDEDTADVGAGPVICRGGQCQAENERELGVQKVELPVLRTEIMAPLGNAVCFVYSEKSDLRPVQNAIRAG